MSKAIKGSQFQMQTKVVPNHLLDKALGVKLNWFSPIEKDDFKEYQLNGLQMKTVLGLSDEAIDDLNKFWPSREPQWDGIAMSDNDTLYLIEAKSHLSEITPASEGKSEENTEKKNDSILKVAQSVYGIDMDEPTRNAWTHKYYQISNRLAFAHKMKELITPSTKFNDVVMVFINFVNDDTWKPQGLMVSDSNVWDEKYKVMLKEMKLSKPLLDANNVIIINLDVDPKHSNMRQDK